MCGIVANIPKNNDSSKPFPIFVTFVSLQPLSLNNKTKGGVPIVEFLTIVFDSSK